MFIWVQGTRLIQWVGHISPIIKRIDCKQGNLCQTKLVDYSFRLVCNGAKQNIL